MKNFGLTLVVGTFALATYLALNPHWIRIESVDVQPPAGAAHDVLFQRIQSTLAPQLQGFAGRFFWDVSLNRIYDVAAKDKRVRKISIYREFPSRLRVEIEPRTPVLAYLSNDNRIYPLAADATLLPTLPLSESADMPILRGDELKDEPELRASALALLEQIPTEGELRKQNVSEIFYSKKDGFRVFLSGAVAEIRFGDSDFGPKISRVEKVLAYLESQNIKGRVIDARFAKKVVVRVRKAP